MKRNLLFTALTAAMFLVGMGLSQNVNSNANGAPAGSSGSTLDGASCANSTCHVGTASVGTDVIINTGAIPSSGYVAGNTYTLSVTSLAVSTGTPAEYGYLITSESATAKAGTFTASSSDSKRPMGNSSFMTHNNSKASASWSFDWEAPVAGTGTVTFTAALNATNNNGMPTGDQIFVSSKSVNEGTPMSSINNLNSLGLNAFPNPAQDLLNVTGDLNADEVTIEIFNLSGELMLTEVLTGVNQLSAPIDVRNMEAGLYLLRVTADQKVSTLRIAKL